MPYSTSATRRGKGTMSVQFGKWNFDGKPVDPGSGQSSRDSALRTRRGGPILQGQFRYSVSCPPHHERIQQRESSPMFEEPAPSSPGMAGSITARDLSSSLVGEECSADRPISKSCRWRMNAGELRLCAKLTGDWAFPFGIHESWLFILAKDFVGTRHLYYSSEKDQVTWCTILDPLVLLAQHL